MIISSCIAILAVHTEWPGRGIASLEASEKGRKLYKKMGFEHVSNNILTNDVCLISIVAARTHSQL